MFFAGLVVEERRALGGPRDRGPVHGARSVGRLGRRRGEKLQDVERPPRVPPGQGREVQEIVLGNHDAPGSHTPRRPDRPVEDQSEGPLGERRQRVDGAARQQGGVHLERRVLRGRADERDGAALDVGQEGVLLRSVEAVDLVHEQNRSPSRGAPVLLGRAHDILDLLDAGKDGAELDELGPRQAGDETRQSGLPGSRRAPQDHRTDLVALDRRAQRPSRADQLVLSDELVESFGAHSIGEGRRFGRARRVAGTRGVRIR